MSGIEVTTFDEGMTVNLPCCLLLLHPFGPLQPLGDTDANPTTNPDPRLDIAFESDDESAEDRAQARQAVSTI
jgi:hypothetical protein